MSQFDSWFPNITLHFDQYNFTLFFSELSLESKDASQNARYMVHTLQLKDDCAFSEYDLREYVTLRPLNTTKLYTKVLVCLTYYQEVYICVQFIHCMRQKRLLTFVNL